MAKGENMSVIPFEEVAGKITTIRKQSVMADADVAALYGVETRRENEAVKNNVDKFPKGNIFELTNSELQDLRSKFRPQTCRSRVGQ